MSRWIDACRKSGEVKTSSRQCTPEASELSRLKRELHSLKIENEILKQAAAYFESWLYLAGVKELYNKEIVGYYMSDRMTKDSVIRELKAAILKNKTETGLILHSDQGSQYCSNEYWKISNSYGMQLSMSRKGKCWDNTPMESFWGLLKNELVHHTAFATRAESRKTITEYSELFYNRQRIQADPGFLSPATFAVRQRQSLACAA